VKDYVENLCQNEEIFTAFPRDEVLGRLLFNNHRQTRREEG
jgi:hypothetical protein